MNEFDKREYSAFGCVVVTSIECKQYVASLNLFSIPDDMSACVSVKGKRTTCVSLS